MISWSKVQYAFLFLFLPCVFFLISVWYHPDQQQVEQIHKIFKLCGSPSEEYWQKSKLAHASSFKPQHPYKRRLAETFRNFPSSALALVDVLLSVEPDARGTAASALKSEVISSSVWTVFQNVTVGVHDIY